VNIICKTKKLNTIRGEVIKVDKRHSYLLGLALLGSTVSAPTLAADSLAEALSSGKAYGNFRLRYETVEQNNARDDAEALTLRSRIGYKTGSIGGFSALVEFEDNRVVAGVEDYSVPVTGFNGSDFSVIADPSVTELDQAYLQYKNDVVTAKLGAQVLTLDNHRFIGHVGWRQDRQTFDALSLKFTPNKKFDITLANLYKRNRIFAEAGDIESNDNLFNISYKTGVGKLTGYAYLLEVDSTGATLDTVGARFAGAAKSGSNKFLYEVELAEQDAENGTTKNDTDYSLVSLGFVTSGVTFKVGQEVLGSDNGAVGFATPLATLHKFNGWADVFLNTPASGLEDTFFLVSSKLGPGKVTAVYHDFSADEGSVGDHGSEVDIAYGMKFGKNYFGGIKYADYSADNTGVDTEKLAVWLGAKF
jgi:hypothetical protein